MADDQHQHDTGILEKPAPRLKEPEMYRVVLHNDDYTSMEFVVEVLESVFHKSPVDANRIMLKVHVEGRGVAGSYPYELAETKVEMVHERARGAGFPLHATAELVQ
jgi:ATP-dependent Clp protease adaptor protein ClpS